MIQRTLGCSDIRVSVIGFGASPLGDVYGPLTPAESKSAVHCAIDSGINFFDVSPYYGVTLAEERLGEALSGHRHNVVLATKCGRYGTNDFDFSASTMVRRLEESLLRLRTDYVDLLQLHDVEFGSFDQIVDEALPALRNIQAQGKARLIGITGYWPHVLERIATTTKVDTILNYCHFNLMAHDMNDSLTPFASARDIGLLNASPLHMGLLGGGPIMDWHPAPPEVRRAATAVVALCRDCGVKPATMALHVCLQHPTVASTFMGFRNASQVEDALNAFQWTPPDGLMERVTAIIKPVFNRTWNSGLSENQPTEPAHAD